MTTLPRRRDEAEKVKVLVVDDEPAITELVATVLRYEGFAVSVAGSGREAMREARALQPDLVILDVMLPDGDGFDLLPRLRSSGEVPVLFLTARDGVADRVRGLTIGADDYVTKPFSLEELIARVRSVLRRARIGSASSVLRVGDLELDDEACEVRRAGQAIQLTPTEFSLLRCLIEHAGQVLSKQQLLDRVWQYDFGGSDGIVETYIRYLRRKVDSGRSPLIHTVRGFGYVLREAPASP